MDMNTNESPVNISGIHRGAYLVAVRTVSPSQVDNVMGRLSRQGWRRLRVTAA